MKTYLIKYSLVFFVGFALWSCTSDPWSKKQKSAFLESCENEGASPGYCDCFLNQTMKKYPKYEDALGMSFEEAVELSLECD